MQIQYSLKDSSQLHYLETQEESDANTSAKLVHEIFQLYMQLRLYPLP